MNRSSLNIINLCFAALLTLLPVYPQRLAAQDFLLDPTVKIARHDKRTTRNKFLRQSADSQAKKLGPLDSWGMMFERSVTDNQALSDSKLIHYEKLPQCEKAEVRLIDVFNNTPGTDSTDVLYYDPDDPAQLKQALSYGQFKVPYKAALTPESNSGHPEYWQSFARFIQLECLPTRFRFSYVGSQRYIEYRLGASAWETKPNN